MSAGRASLTAHTGPVYTPTPISEASWDHGIAVGSGDVQGLNGSIVWDDAADLSPLDDTWIRESGHYVDVEWTDDRGTTRIISGRVDDSDGGTDQVQAKSGLTDWTSRLEATLDLRPVGYRMPANPLLAGGVKRSPGLMSYWFTHQALTRAGFYPSQAVMTSSVLYVSMCGSAWPIPDLKHAFSPLGECRQVHRIGDTAAAPVPAAGDDCPVTSNVYGLYMTRPTNSTLPWQLTVDLGTITPAPGDTGRVSMRRSSAQAGLELDWTQDSVRVFRLNVGGTRTLLSTHARDRAGSFRQRWSLVGRPDGTGRLMCEDDTSGNRTWNAVADYGAHGAEMPTGSIRMGVRVESEGRIGAVQVARADSSLHVERVTGAKILRSADAYNVNTRALTAWDYVPATSAGALLADQADAERGLRGMPICQWINHEGQLINADFQALVDGALNPGGGDVEHYIGPGQVTALDNVGWSLPGVGPWREVTVEYVAMRRRGDNAKLPTRLLAQGRQETIERGDDYEVILHPEEGEVWLEPELRPRLAGHPYGVPYGKWLDRGIGTIVGGSRRDGDGNRAGWITPTDITEWSLGADGTVNGALTMLDPRTVVISGTVATPTGLDMSTMPDDGSAGLPEPRKRQPLPQLRGYSKAIKIPSVATVQLTGNERHPSLTHDCGLWVQASDYAAYIASEYAESLTDPILVVTIDCELDPWIKVGEVVEAWYVRPDASTLMVRGVVLRSAGSIPAPDDGMRLTVAVTSRKVKPPDEPPPPMLTPLPAPPRNTDPPPGTEPPPNEPS